MLTKEIKAQIVRQYVSDTKNTGNSAVQIALLSKRIQIATEHLKSHRYDHASRRGLLKLVSRRKSLLRYISRKDPAAYEKLCADLDVK